MGLGTLFSVMAHPLYSCGDTSTHSLVSNPPNPSPSPSESLPSPEIITVDAKGSVINRRPLPKLQVHKEDLSNDTTLEMVLIPGGTFTMGSPTSELERGDEGPLHEVTVSSFYLGKYQVTQAQWEAIMGSNPSKFRGANRPVEWVSWDEAVEFCQKLTQASGKEYRLPSEAEWEYACRAGTTTPFYFGETITPKIANYNGRFIYGSGPKGEDRQQTTEVGNFPPNAFGLYDMHGNVGEWCQDTWHDNYKGAPTNGSAWISENDNNSHRVRRGGSWAEIPKFCRSADRNRDFSGARSEFGGFRVVLVAPSTIQ